MSIRQKSGVYRCIDLYIRDHFCLGKTTTWMYINVYKNVSEGYTLF